jgi:hypothetical protein
MGGGVRNFERARKIGPLLFRRGVIRDLPVRNNQIALPLRIAGIGFREALGNRKPVAEEKPLPWPTNVLGPIRKKRFDAKHSGKIVGGCKALAVTTKSQKAEGVPSR